MAALILSGAGTEGTRDQGNKKAGTEGTKEQLDGGHPEKRWAYLPVGPLERQFLEG
jgi:hypothetical protein